LATQLDYACRKGALNLKAQYSMCFFFVGGDIWGHHSPDIEVYAYAAAQVKKAIEVGT